MQVQNDAAPDFNIVIVAQSGRLGFEAVLFAASLRHHCPDFKGKLLIAEPEPGPRWAQDPRMGKEVRDLLLDFGAQIVPFQSKHFGDDYPYGNKIEMLSCLPKAEPFVFFDTDTLITGDLAQVPFDFSRPGASLRREGTWPTPALYGPGYAGIWKALYDMFGLDFESSLDLSEPDEYWKRYLYFNAGFFYYECPHVFGARFLHYALTVRDSEIPEMACQKIYPWLDQIVLPLVIHSLGGGRDALPCGYLDGKTSCHYRNFPLLYAREAQHVIDTLETVAAPNKIKKVLKQYEPIKRIVFQKRGHKVRALFDQNDLPKREQVIRNRIKSNGFWLR